MTIYDYDPAYRGAAFVVEPAGRTRLADDNSPISRVYRDEAVSERWSAIASFWAIKDHRWITGPSPLTIIPDTPNADYFPLDETWRWAGNVAETIDLPYQRTDWRPVAEQEIGVQGQRTTISAPPDPDGGTPLRQLGAVTLRMEPYGAQTGPAINVLDLRTSKEFRIGGGDRVEFNFDLFNLLNSSAQTDTQFQGEMPTFLYTDRRGAPRIVRLGVRYTFLEKMGPGALFG